MSLQQREVIITNAEPVPVGLDAPAVAATGTITLGEVANGNTVTIDDGVNTPTTFEFDTGVAATGSIVLAAARPAIGDTITVHGVTFELTDGTGAAGDNVEVDISTAASVTDDGVAILAAIKANIAGLNNAGTAGALDTDYTITLTWGTVGEAGNDGDVAVTGANLSATDMTGGLDAGDDVTPGNVGVVVAVAGNASAANLLAAINAAVSLDITATHTDPASATINLTNDTPGAAGNVTITKSGAPITVTGMVGGLDAVDLYTLAESLDTLQVTANPPTVTLTTISGVKDQTGANATISAPTAGTKVRIHAFQLQLEEAPAGSFQRVLIKSDTVELWRYVGTQIESGVIQVFPAGQELDGGNGKGISLDLAESKDVGYVIRYRIVDA
jgi:hypothetical protein